MKKVQYHRLEMALRVESYLNDNAELVAGNAPMQATVAILKEKIAAILLQMGLQQHNHKGITEDKKEMRIALEAQAFVMSSGCGSYATATGDTWFYKITRHTKSDLIHFRDDELSGKCVILLGYITDHDSELLAYGITADMIADFQTAIDNFREITNKPSNAIANKAEATAQIKVLLPQIMDIIRVRLASDMVMMSVSEPKFASVFKNVSRLGKNPVHKRSLTVVVKDFVTGKPLAQAIIETDKNIKRKTGKKGQSYVAHLPAGRHKLEVSHAGYQSQSLKYTVIHGLATKVEVLLTKTVTKQVLGGFMDLEETAKVTYAFLPLRN